MRLSSTGPDLFYNTGPSLSPTSYVHLIIIGDPGSETALLKVKYTANRKSSWSFSGARVSERLHQAMMSPYISPIFDLGNVVIQLRKCTLNADYISYLETIFEHLPPSPHLHLNSPRLETFETFCQLLDLVRPKHLIVHLTAHFCGDQRTQYIFYARQYRPLPRDVATGFAFVGFQELDHLSVCSLSESFHA